MKDPFDDDDKDLYEGPEYACEKRCSRKFWPTLIAIAIIIPLLVIFCKSL
jgi:hypothetical protein